jgi:hypothetical protein
MSCNTLRNLRCHAPMVTRHHGDAAAGRRDWFHTAGARSAVVARNGLDGPAVGKAPEPAKTTLRSVGRSKTIVPVGTQRGSQVPLARRQSRDRDIADCPAGCKSPHREAANVTCGLAVFMADCAAIRHDATVGELFLRLGGLVQAFDLGFGAQLADKLRLRFA